MEAVRILIKWDASRFTFWMPKIALQLRTKENIHELQSLDSSTLFISSRPHALAAGLGAQMHGVSWVAIEDKSRSEPVWILTLEQFSNPSPDFDFHSIVFYIL